MRVCAGRKSAFVSVHTDIGEQRHPWKWHSSCFQSHLDFLATVKKRTVHYNHCSRQHMTVTCITSQGFVSKNQKHFLYLSFCLLISFLVSIYYQFLSFVITALFFFQVSWAPKYMIHLVFSMAICDHNLITLQHEIHLWCGPLRKCRLLCQTQIL